MTITAWRCWGLHRREPGILGSLLAPFRHCVEWQPGPGWQPPAACAFHDHFAPDDGPVCARCGWRGQPDLDELIWWLADFKRVVPHVVGRVELGGKILRGDHAHPEIPGILRAELVAITGPLILMPGLPAAGAHVRALADRYGAEVIEGTGERWSRTWVRSVPDLLAA